MYVRTVNICTNDDIFCTTSLNFAQLQRPSRTNTEPTVRYVLFQVAKTASQQVLGPLKIKKLYVLAALLVCPASFPGSTHQTDITSLLPNSFLHLSYHVLR